MSYVKKSIPNLEEDEQGYKFTDEPCKGKLCAVKAHSSPQVDGDGHFVSIYLKATGRWVDSNGNGKTFPGHGEPVKAATSETNMDGTATIDDTIDSLLDGIDGSPEPLPSPLRRAIQAAQSMEE